MEAVRGERMTIARLRYRVVIHPGGKTMEATARLAKRIIDEWMPGNGGGVTLMIGPDLCALLHPLFQKAQAQNRDLTIEVDTTNGTRPVITEVVP